MATKAKVKPKQAERPQRIPTPGINAALPRERVADALGVSIRKFAAMLATGEFPPAELFIGQHPRWTIEFINRWIDEQKSKPRPERTRRTMEV